MLSFKKEFALPKKSGHLAIGTDVHLCLVAKTVLPIETKVSYTVECWIKSPRQTNQTKA